jgi:hypothetical protein
MSKSNDKALPSEKLFVSLNTHWWILCQFGHLPDAMMPEIDYWWVFQIENNIQLSRYASSKCPYHN